MTPAPPALPPNVPVRVLVPHGPHVLDSGLAWSPLSVTSHRDDALATDLRLRDESDAARMQPAEDAIQIDTTDLDVEDVVAQIEELVRARQPA